MLRMIEHYLQLEDARVVQTPAFLVALENMRGVLVRRAITVMWGPSGYGKTVAGRAIYGQLLGVFSSVGGDAGVTSLA